MEEIKKERSGHIWGREETRLCDWQSGGDRRNNRHDSRKKNRIRPHAVRNRNRGPELQKNEEKKEEEKEKRERTNESMER